jgi:TrmH family RNA methyltransferase
MERISGQKSPSGVLAIAQIPAPPALSDLPGVTLYLDRISDPGNMGTVIRSAEWFGVQQVLLSPECVDPWSPKVLQASMGSLFRMPVIEKELKEALILMGDPTPVVYAADMQGKDVNTVIPADKSVVIIGSEAHGVSKGLHAMVQHYITIPKASETPVPDSLNASVAASIICFCFSKNRKI